MKKAIMLSDKPKWCAKIMNGDKTIEVRTKFPKDFVGWVYLYCTKGTPYLSSNSFKYYIVSKKTYKSYIGNYNGKVVARFWCDKVGVIKLNYCLTIPTIAYTTFADKYYSDNDLQVASCLNANELMRYLGTDKKEVGYAIHISKLEIFGIPKEISEFYGYYKRYQVFSDLLLPVKLSKAPQNYCYVVEEELE